MASFGCLILPRKVNNDCIAVGGGGGGPGPPGPPGPPGMDANSICIDTACFDFDEFNAGDTCFNLFRTSVMTNDPGNHSLMIFDADVPSAGDTGLGTPNMDFAGPGVGAGGQLGMPGQNDTARGKVLIVSQDNNSLAPLSYAGNSLVTFTFDDPVNTVSMDFLSVEQNGWQVELFDSGGTSIIVYAVSNLGRNSIQTRNIPGIMVKRIEVTMIHKGAIVDLKFDFCKGDSGGGTVVLKDNDMVGVVIPDTEIQGAYKIIVESALCDGAKATFNVSKAYDNLFGNIVRISNSPSLLGEKIHVLWNPNEPVKLYHRVLRTVATGACVPYLVKVVNI